LWITNSGVQKALSVKYRNGSWESFDVNSIVNSDVSKVMIDRNNYVWMLVRGNRPGRALDCRAGWQGGGFANHDSPL
jgi:streptogramin lyase